MSGPVGDTARLPAGGPATLDLSAPDSERRFGGLRRLWGETGYGRVRAARLAVVGLGGVGSWAAEALARCGVAELVLIDLDHVAESNINRQIQALGSTLGAAKVEALAQRLSDIHPGCRMHCVDDFVTPENWPGLLPVPVDAVVDACDQGRAKLALARWALATGTPLIVAGAAGGKTLPQAVEVADLAEVTHDPMLARLRQQLRRDRRDAQPAASGRPARPGRSDRREPPLGLTCVFSRESLQRPEGGCEVDGSLNCSGYGSSVMVTATFGMTAASVALQLLRERNAKGASRIPGAFEAAAGVP